MKATDLRIGNLIGYKEVDLKKGIDVIKYKQCTLSDIAEIERGNICDRYSFIPLTEEWLIKFGYSNNQDYYFLKNNKKYYYFWNKRDGAGICTYEKCYDDIVIDEIIIKKKIKYVHQLQNLYHALTGEELIIK